MRMLAMRRLIGRVYSKISALVGSPHRIRDIRMRGFVSLLLVAAADALGGG